MKNFTFSITLPLLWPLFDSCVNFSRVCLGEGKLIQVLEVVLKMMDLFTSRSLI